MHLNWIKLASNPCGLDRPTGRAADRYPKGASSKLARVNIFQLISVVSDYHEKFLFIYISEGDSEINWVSLARMNMLTIETVNK